MSNRARLNDSDWKKILDFLLSQPDIYVGKPQKCRRFISGVLFLVLLQKIRTERIYL
ncbi:hypothetical protein [Myxosarcina sp. GI1(2024)]